MTIHYSLAKNTLVAGANDFIARVQPTDSVGLEDLIDFIDERGSTVTRTDIRAVLEDAIEASCQMLELGLRVNFGGLCSLFTAIKGRFEDADSTFDPEVQQLEVKATAGTRIKNRLRRKAVLEKEIRQPIMPLITKYKDAKSGQMNSTISPGSVGGISGKKLKFHTDRDDEGLYFEPIGPGGHGPPEIKASVFIRNSPSRLIFQIPENLQAETEYTITVRTRYTPNGSLRVGKLPEAILGYG